jgi:hypothetical protein
MKRFLLLLLLIPSLVYGAAGDVASVNGKAITAVASVAGKANAAILTIGGKPCSDGDAVDYCTSQSWDTFAAFKFDFDHTTNNLYACLASGTSTGTLVNAAAGQVTGPTPATTGIGSGGNALVTDATAEYVTFTNTSSIFQSKYGEIMFKVNLAGNNAADYYVFQIVQTAAQERLQVYITATGQAYVLWEDNDHGAVQIVAASAADFDDNYGDWAQIHIKWDTTRCSDGTCDGVGEDELGIRVRFDTNNDGDFDDGGDETWSAWAYETSAIDMGAWATEPTTDKIQFGLISGAFDQAIWVDDLEISNAQPSW